MSKYSTALFATPTWAEGVSRLVDFGGTFDEYNVSPTEVAADSQALWRDWLAVGGDLEQAIREHAVER